MHIDRLKLIEWSVVVLLVAVVLLLHSTFLNQSGALWRDEINSVNLASMPALSQIFSLLPFDSFPLLWTLLLRGWIGTGIGTTDFGLRLFGLLGGLTLLFAVCFASLKLTKTVPLVSFALIAVNPEIIRWGDSVRAWGLGASLSIITLFFVQKATKLPTKFNVALAALFGILSVQCTYQNSVFLVAIITAVALPSLLRRDWKTAAIPLSIGMIAATSVLLYFSVIRRVGEWNMLVQVNFTLEVFVTKILEVINASGSFIGGCWLAIVFAALIVLVRREVWSKMYKNEIDGDVVITNIGVLVLAIGGLVAMYLKLGYSTESWYYIGLLTLVVSSAEIAIRAAMQTNVVRAALAVFALLILVTGIIPAGKSLSIPQTNMDEIAYYFNANVELGDVVIVNPWYLVITLDRYYHGISEVTPIPPLEDRKLHRYDLIKRAMLSGDPTPLVISKISQSLKLGHKAWLVGYFPIPSPDTKVVSLTKPPLPSTGWSAYPYIQSWTLEVGAFLREHALGLHVWRTNNQAVRFETVEITVVHGWRP